MGKRVLPLLVAGLLLLSLHLEQVDCQGNFVPSCPPPEATMTHTDGTGLIQVSTNDRSTVPISWTIGYSIAVLQAITRCFPTGAAPNHPCSSGDQFPITFPFTGSISYPARVIQVQYDVFLSMNPDGSVNSDLCTFYLSVLDTGKPTLQCPTAVEVPGDEQGFTMGTANWTVPVPTDNSDAAITLTSNINPMTPPITYAIGTREITYTATDQSGNSASCSFNVTVTDAKAPDFLDCPADVVTRCTTFGQSTASVTFDLPNATDNSPETPNVECFIVGFTVPLNNSGNMVPIGTHNVQCNASDSAQNVNSSCQFIITVLDKEDPNITCSGNDTRGTDFRQNFTTVILPGPDGATENSGVYNITILLEDGNVYSINDTYQFQLRDSPHQLNYTITDGSGNTDICDVFITIVDLEPPFFEDCPADVYMSADPDQPTAVITFDLPNATDNSHNTVNVVCFEDGTQTVLDHVGAIVSIGPTSARCNATDAAGLVNSSCTFSISIPDLQAPIFTDCPAAFIQNTSSGQPTASVYFFLPNATDNSNSSVTVECFADRFAPGETRQAFNNWGGLLGIGVNVIQCNATDPSMQVNVSCSFTITVEDKEDPNITCPANFTMEVTDSMQYYNSFTLPDVTEAFDNSGVYNITIDIGEATVYFINDTVNFNFTSSPHRLRYTITDEAGLTDFCDVYLFVQDNELPQLTCPSNQTNNTLPGQPNGTVYWSEIMRVDNSMQNVIFLESMSSGSEFPIGDTTVYVNATDGSGNVAACNFTVTIIDNERPVFTNCVNLTFPTSPGLPMAYITFMHPAAVDNSGGTVTVNCIGINPNGDTLQQGIHSFVCVAIDQDAADRSSSSCFFDIIIEDNEPPNITCPGNRTVYTAPGKSYASFALPMEESSVDNSGFIPIITVIVEGTTYNVGEDASFNVSMSPFVVQYFATDNSTNNASCDFNVTVIDNEDPILMCPRNVEMLVTRGQLFGTPTWPSPEITDNSGEIDAVAASHINGTSMIYINNKETVVYNATDPSGNVGYCNFTVLVVDTEPPVLVCPDNRTEPTEFNSSYAIATWNEPTVMDNTPAMVSLTSDKTNGTSVNLGETLTVTYTGTDASGNNGTCFFQVTAIDMEPPRIDCPANQTVTTDPGQNFSTFALPPEASSFDNSGELPTITIKFDNMVFNVGERAMFNFEMSPHLVWYVATDAAMNNATCEVYITVTDKEAPNITCPENIVNNTDPGLANATVTWSDPIVTDNIFWTTVVGDETSGSVFGIGTHLVKYNATDSSGNTNYCNFTIKIMDNEPPVFGNCPNLNFFTSPGQPTAYVTYTIPSATDNSGGTVVVNCLMVRNDGAYLSIGLHQDVACVAIDHDNPARLSSSCKFNITVKDNESPNITCPSNRTVYTDPGQDYATFRLPAEEFSIDNSGYPPDITIDVESRIYSVGNDVMFNLSSMPYLVQYTATDNFTNNASCDFYIMVIDNESPNITCPSNRTVYTDPGQDYATFSLPPEEFSIDNSGYPPDITIDVESRIYSVGNDVMFNLSSMPYLVQYTATDNSTNNASCDFLITVIDKEAPNITCPENIVNYTDPGLANATVAWSDPIVTDNSRMVTFDGDETSGSSFGIGTHLVKYNATDSSGNTNYCNFTITIIDNESPNITCPSNRTVYTDPGQDYATFRLPPEEFSIDNSGYPPEITVDVESRTYSVGNDVMFNLSSMLYLVQYTATDNFTNNASCDFYIMVIDIEAPNITCPENIVNNTDPGLANATVTWSDPIVTDNSRMVTFDGDETSGSVFGIGTHLVKYNATDSSGNTNYCNFTIKIIGSHFSQGFIPSTVISCSLPNNEPPVIGNCPNLNFFTSPGQPTAYVTYTIPSATDNSGGTVVVNCIMVRNDGDYLSIGLHQDVACVAIDHDNPARLTSSCKFNITVKDNESPNITCPSNRTVYTDPGQDYATFSLPPEEFSIDNSGYPPDITIDVESRIYSVGNDVMFNLSSMPYLVQYTARDNSTNNASCDFLITVIDKEAPNITCPENIVNNTDPGLANATVTWSDPMVTDNSRMVTFDGDETSGSSFGIGTHLVKYNATDSSGNTNYCNFTIKIIDNEPPVIGNCPNLNFFTSPGQPTAYVTYTIPSATDNSGGTVVVNCIMVRNDGDYLSIGLHQDVACVAIDHDNPARLTSSCKFNITVKDNESPNITCPSNRTVYTDPGQDYATVRLPPEEFSIDNSGYPPDITIDVESRIYSVGNDARFNLSNMPYLVQYTARDNSTNNASCDFYIMVIDNEPPNMTCPIDVYNTTNVGSATGSAFWPDAIVVDNSWQTPIVETNLMSGSMFDVGVHFVHFNATDNSGNTNNCTFNVTIEDLELPQFTDCENITKTSIFNESFAFAQIYQPNATDNSPGSVTIECPGSSEGYLKFFIGYNYIPCTAKDIYNNTATCHRTVFVEDNEDPKITCPGNQSLVTEMSKNYVTVTLSPPEAVSDNSNIFNVTIIIDGWTEYVGDSIRFNLSVTPHRLQYIVRDSFQRNATCDTFISVSDNEIPDIMCPEHVRNTTLDNQPDGEVFWPLPVVTDNSLLPITPVTDRPPGSLFSIGVHMVHYNATDASGNSNNCSFNVTVVDEYPPQFPDCRNFTKGTDNGVASTFVSFFEPNATDNSGGNVTINCTSGIQAAGQVLPIGMYAVHCIAYDPFGNEGVCLFYVQVIDDEDPQLGCPTHKVVNTNQGLNTALVTLENVTHSSDNDGPPSIAICVGTNMHSVGENVTFNLAMSPHQVMYKVSDAAGNTASCNITVVVEDREMPVIVCPAPVTVNTTTGQSTGIANWPPPTVTDNSNETITPSSNVSMGVGLPIGEHFIQYTAVDGSSNSQTCNFSVTVQDRENPMLTCADKTVPTQTGQAYALLSLNLPVVMDNSGASLTAVCTQSGAGGDQVGIGIHTINCEATDPYGNRGTCTFMLTVTDQERPMITCPTNTSLGTAAPLGTASFTVPAPVTSMDNSNLLSVTISLMGTSVNSGQVLTLAPQPSPYVFVYTATDTALLVQICYFGLTVIDDDPPTFSGCPTDFTVCVGSQSETALVRWTPPVATDNIAVVTESSNIMPNSRLSPPGNTVVYTAVDGASLRGTCEFMVTVAVATTGIMRYQLTVIMDMIRGTPGSGASLLLQNLADDLEDLFRTPGNPLALLIVTISPVRSRLTGNDIIVEMEMTLKDSTLTPSNIEQAFDALAPLNQFPTGNVALGNTFTIGPGGCTSSSVCQNGGSCRPGRAGSHECDCTAGFTGTDCSTDVDECAVAANSQLCASQGLSCYNALGTYSCNCPHGYWRNGNSGTCRAGKTFRIFITIVTLNQLGAVFTNDYLVSTSTAYVRLRGEVEIAVYNILIVLPGYGFLQVRVLSFSAGSIVPALIVTVDPNSPVTQQNIQETLNQAITSNNNNLGNNIGVSPQGVNVAEEVCQADYCMNSGVCSMEPTTFTSVCSCVNGFTGDRCQTQTGGGGTTGTTASPGDGGGGGGVLSTEAIIAIAVGGTILLIIIIMVVLGVCFLMSRTSSSRTGAMYGRDPYKYYDNQRRRENLDRGYTRDERDYRMNAGQFSVPYIASGQELVPMNRLPKNPYRGDADYF